MLADLQKDNKRHGNDIFDGFALTAPLLMDEMIVKEIRISAGELSSYGWLTGDGYQITGVIDHIQVVPVPAAVWLFGTALGCLAWLRRKDGSCVSGNSDR